MRSLVAAAAAALVLVPAAEATPPNACKLLTKAEAARVLGPYVSTESYRTGKTSTCIWHNAGAQFGSVELDVTEAGPRGSFEFIQRATPGAVTRHGVGESAFEVEGVLWVYSGRYKLVLMTSKLPAALTVETRVARLAVSHL